MKLPITLPFHKKETVSYYLSLLLNDEKIHAVIFEEIEGKIHVVGENEQNLPESIDTLPFEQLLEILDRTISQAERTLPENIETQKTIFGVKETWIDDTTIKKDYLAKLKKICDALGLSPIGFLVIHEAVSHLLEKEEGAPPSAILVEVGNKEVVVSVLRAGKVLETKRKKIDDSLAKTIDKALHYFTSYEILPSRIIVFNGHDTDEISQELITHQWSKSLPFLHVPQITILPKHFDARAVLHGAATQMGFEITEEKSQKEKIKTIMSPSEKNTIKEKKAVEEEAQENDLQEENVDDLGFVQNKDIVDINDEEELKTKDTDDDEIPVKKQHIHEQEKDEKHHFETQELQKDQKLRNTQPLTRFGKLFQHIKLPQITTPAFLKTFPQGKRRGLLFIPPVVIGLCIILFLLYIFTLSATATIIVNPKIFEKNQNVTFDTEKDTDLAKGILKADDITTNETGEVSTPATGTKEIGDKAKGTVTIVSSATKSQTIPSGTTITSSNGLSFVLDNSISLASSSGVTDIKTIQASVTAKDIGKEYNLPGGTKFSVGTFDRSSIEAKNDTAFSGGSKKEITVVATKDVNKLLNDLSKTLEEKGKDDATKKLSSDQKFLAIIDHTLTKKSFNKNVGDEASTVTLSGTVSYKALAYRQTAITDIAKQLIKENNDNVDLSKGNIETTVVDTKTKGETITGNVQIKASLLPTIDQQKLAENIAGKSFTDAKSLLLTTPQTKDVTFQLHPSIPFLPPLLPRSASKIKIVITTNE